MKTGSCHALVLSALVLTGACGDSAAPRPILDHLTPADVAGAWNIAFLVDSVQDCSSGSCRAVPAGLRPIVVGEIAIADRFDTLYTEYLTAELQVDFEPALGRQVTCLAIPQASLVLPGDSGTAGFWFTPGAADCGLTGSAQFDGREFHGTWGEPSFTSQPLSAGTFRMWRKG
jgi:hypothetical protein